MTSRSKRQNEIEEEAEKSSEKKSKVRKLSSTRDFIVSMRARFSEAKAEPIGPYRRKKGKWFFSTSLYNLFQYLTIFYA